jgi:electron transfer flavoprotein beta subunit
MKILVCISHVPDTAAKIAFTDDNTKFDEEGVQFKIGPYDDYALAKAVELKTTADANVTLLNVGLENTRETLIRALAIGADDAIRVNAHPTDSMFVARQIAHVAKEGQYDLIMMGRESIDYNSGVVHGLVGSMLDMPSISPVMELDIDGDMAKISRETEGGKEFIEVKLPIVVGCQEPIAEWKVANMRGIMQAKMKPMKVVEPVTNDGGSCEVTGYDSPAPKGPIKLIEPENAEQLIDLLVSEAKVL